VGVKEFAAVPRFPGDRQMACGGQQQAYAAPSDFSRGMDGSGKAAAEK
jgi:hypothetical protein